jgi:hypothetical protein
LGFLERERGFPQKAVVLLDNAHFHPRDSVLTSADGLIVVKFLPPMLQLTIVHPMGQGVIASMKQHYQSDLFRTLANEDDNMIASWKK